MRAEDTRRAWRDAVRMLRGVDLPRLQQALERNVGGYPSSWGAGRRSAALPDPTAARAAGHDPAVAGQRAVDDAVGRLWRAAADLAGLCDVWAEEMVRVTPCGNVEGCPDGNMAHVGRRVQGVPVCEACYRFWRRGGGWRRFRRAS